MEIIETANGWFWDWFKYKEDKITINSIAEKRVLSWGKVERKLEEINEKASEVAECIATAVDLIYSTKR